MITNYRLGTEKLEKVRYQNYMKMVASATKINPSKLPPSRRSAWFHSLRTYLQVMEWKTLKMGLQLDPTNWGWKEENEKLRKENEMLEKERMRSASNNAEAIRQLEERLSKNNLYSNFITIFLPVYIS